MGAVIELVTGDCEKLLPVYAAGSFDCVTTSPPYNLGLDYRSGHDDATSRAAYLEWTERWLAAVKRVLSENGSLFLNVGGKPTDPLVPFQVLDVATRHGWKLQNTLYWIKSVADTELGPAPCEGHVKPLNSPHFVNDAVELVFHLTKTGDVPIDRLPVGVPFADQSNLTRGARGKNGNVRCRGNALMISYKTIQRRKTDRPHPATFPVELAEYLMKLHGTSRIRRTLDPFSGLGSSARASRRLGLAHVGIELSAEDTEDAKRLIEEDSR